MPEVFFLSYWEFVNVSFISSVWPVDASRVSRAWYFSRSGLMARHAGDALKTPITHIWVIFHLILFVNAGQMYLFIYISICLFIYLFTPLFLSFLFTLFTFKNITRIITHVFNEYQLWLNRYQDLQGLCSNLPATNYFYLFLYCFLIFFVFVTFCSGDQICFVRRNLDNQDVRRDVERKKKVVVISRIEIML